MSRSRKRTSPIPLSAARSPVTSITVPSRHRPSNRERLALRQRHEPLPKEPPTMSLFIPDDHTNIVTETL